MGTDFHPVFTTNNATLKRRALTSFEGVTLRNMEDQSEVHTPEAYDLVRDELQVENAKAITDW